jgi:hypothetical protein
MRTIWFLCLDVGPSHCGARIESVDENSEWKPEVGKEMPDSVSSHDEAAKEQPIVIKVFTEEEAKSYVERFNQFDEFVQNDIFFGQVCELVRMCVEAALKFQGVSQ